MDDGLINPKFGGFPFWTIFPTYENSAVKISSITTKPIRTFGKNSHFLLIRKFSTKKDKIRSFLNDLHDLFVESSPFPSSIAP